MTEPVLLPSPEWEKRLGIKVHDPDGWRGRIPQAKDFGEPISEEEFRQRAMVSTIERIAPARADRDQPEFRVGGKQPGNLYRNNKRFGFVLRDEDGPLVAAVLNAYMEGREPDLGPPLEAKDAEIGRLREQLAEAVQMVKICTGHPDTGQPAHADLVLQAKREREAAALIDSNLTGDDRVSLGEALHSLDLLDDEDLSGVTFKAVEWFEQWLARRSAGLPGAAEPPCACPRVQIHAHTCEGREAQAEALVEAMDDHQSECGVDTSWAGLADVSLDSLAEVLPEVPSGGDPDA